MVSREEKGEVEYRGGARLWQGEDRIEADRITILRQAGNLSAEGGVKSYLRARENREGPGAKQEDASSRMLIQADSMRYEEASRQASYRGETSLRRGALLIRSEELDAWFTSAQSGGVQSGGAQSGGSQTLKEAVARGKVRISEPSADGGVRKGYGHEAVYDPTAAVARLQGAPARVVDEAGNETRGPELTYRLNDDRLLVQGKEDDRAYSLRRRNQP
jgi:lipopolysaccharide transport protein LptA